MHTPATRILAHHKSSLEGTLRLHRFKSSALGISKNYYVYEPPASRLAAQTPHLLYLLRGHEREWVNPREDDSRLAGTALEDLDRLILAEKMPPMIAVLPGLNSSNNWVPSLGINMVGTWSPKFRGLGSGRFWSYLSGELMPAIEARYGKSGFETQSVAGFSLGGYTATLLAAMMPGQFDHVAIYDGTFMWPGHRDPRRGAGAFNDKIWCRSQLFDAALGRPRDRLAMVRWNSTDIIRTASAETLRKLAETTFWVSSAARDGAFGNRDRARKFIQILQTNDIPVGFERNVFDAEAAHTWHWADRFLCTFLLQALGDPSALANGLSFRTASSPA